MLQRLSAALQLVMLYRSYNPLISATNPITALKTMREESQLDDRGCLLPHPCKQCLSTASWSSQCAREVATPFSKRKPTSKILWKPMTSRPRSTLPQPKRRPNFLSLVRNSFGASLVVALWRFWCPKTRSLATWLDAVRLLGSFGPPKPRINRSVKRYAKVGGNPSTRPLNAVLRTFLRCRGSLA